MHGDQDGLEGRPAAGRADAVETDVPLPLAAPVGAALVPVAAALSPVEMERSEQDVRAFRADVTRLAGLVGELTTAAGALGKRLDDEVRGVLDGAEKALTDARGARRQAGEADDRTRDAETRAEAALKEDE